MGASGERGDEVAEALDARGVFAVEEQVLDVSALEREVATGLPT